LAFFSFGKGLLLVSYQLCCPWLFLGGKEDVDGVHSIISLTFVLDLLFEIYVSLAQDSVCMSPCAKNVKHNNNANIRKEKNISEINDEKTKKTNLREGQNTLAKNKEIMLQWKLSASECSYMNNKSPEE